MFTGIIEELGSIQNIHASKNTLVLTLQGRKVMEDLKIGDSIAVNGVCLTVIDFTHTSFSVDVMPETYKSTSLSTLHKGSLVNLERALTANGRLGGHFVTGHVDAVGQIIKREHKENAIYIELTFPIEFDHLVLNKGSIALDGTSLTVFGNRHGHLTVALIPHTAKESVIGHKKIGDQVNIEFDMLGKYLFSFWQSREDRQLSINFLKENGFL
ncbi:riboflavin synthase [Robertmurraya sp. DFI.2.37]|jgi:riboflavin synthase|uniref:riboflavin synthase n=1 Tax=Robertmurraya sp. DFI.2.37 TaxID=3031819 RepID=UPI0012452CE4|nr:riboflavin synthase [Robertmurraya sp. DFI.2.37]MDF1507931.1 riboflavin synthase [Robertmurraya sp. DFI.2.37]